MSTRGGDEFEKQGLFCAALACWPDEAAPILPRNAIDQVFEKGAAAANRTHASMKLGQQKHTCPSPVQCKHYSMFVVDESDGRETALSVTRVSS